MERPMRRETPMLPHNVLRMAAAVLATTFLAGTARAEYPERPIRLVVPYAAGGGTDQIARILGEKLAPRLRQAIVVENKPGANGNIGAEAVATAPPDGYTLLFAGLGPLAVNTSLYARMPYDPTTAFAPIVKVSSAPLVLVAGPGAPAGGLQPLLAHARKARETLTMANAGTGSPQHICAGLFGRAAAASILHVAYRGASPAITDLLGGRVEALCENIGTIWPFIEAKRVTPLAVSTRERTSLLPDVPTFEEQGLPGIDFTLWFMLVAPKATPPDIVARLNREVNEILAMPDMIERLRSNAYEPGGGSVAAATEFLLQENKRAPGLVETLGLSRQ
jgi:tripartite-type tricarboxylate transporter receptor subunit TctC